MGNRESFEKNMRRRVEAIRHVSDHSIFNELRGKIVDYNYDEKRVTMEYEVGISIETGLILCLEDLWLGCSTSPSAR